MIRPIRTGRLVASIAVSLAAVTAIPTFAQEQPFQLPAAVPDDVFLCVSERPNPERAFLEAHWAEVWEAFEDSGIVDDLFSLLPVLLGEEEQEEFERLMERMVELVEAVDWKAMCTEEMLFAERLPATFNANRGFMPEMLWLSRGEGDAPAENFEKLVAILDAVAEEANGFAGAEVVHVERSEREGATIASLFVPMGDEILVRLDVAVMDTVVLIGWGQTIFEDSFALLTGEAQSSMAADGRFAAACKSLPVAEDTLTYFDVQGMLGSIRGLADQVLAMELGGGEEESDWKEVINRIIDSILDIPGIIDYVVAVEFTDGLSTHTQTRTALVGDAASKPFYKVVAGRPTLSEFDRYLPVETVSFTVDAGIDPGALYAFLEDTVHGIGPPGEALIEQWVGMQEQMGMDVARDVFGWMEGQTVSATLGRGMGADWVMMSKVTDEELAQEKILAGMTGLGAMVEAFAEEAGNPMLAMMVPRNEPLEHERLGGFHTMTLANQPMVWGTADGYVVLGSNADAVLLSLDTARGEHPNVRENEELMSRMIPVDGGFSTISFTDKRDLGNDVSAMLGMVAMSGMMVPMMIPDPTGQQVVAKLLGMIGKLSPVAAELDFYVSSSSCTSFDGKSWLTREVTYYLPAEKASPEAGAGQDE